MYLQTNRQRWQLVFLLELVVLVMFFSTGMLKLPNLQSDLIIYPILTVTVIITLSRLSWWKEIGLNWSRNKIHYLLFWLPLLHVILGIGDLTNIVNVDIANIIMFFGLCTLIGFCEETIFRGILPKLLLPYGIWYATGISALLFGLIHGVNFFLGYAPEAVILQLVYAGAVWGFAGAALAIYTGTILPLIMLHALVDFSFFIGSNGGVKSMVTPAEIFITFLFSSIAIIYGIVLLNRYQRQLSTKNNPIFQI